MGPSPLSWAPSQYWDGVDGSWSSFALRVGKPQQVCRVLPSTAGQATWVVTPGGCPPGEAGTDSSLTCDQSRGGLFNPAQSKTWNAVGNYSLGLESNLGYGSLSAAYGEDTVAFGFTNANGGPALDSQVVAGIQTDYYYTGIFGLGSQGTNFTNFSDPRPSSLTTMKAKNLIPSLSWAYTAGAPYRSKGVFGSLTFGGYDLSRFFPNNASFSLAPDISRDLVVGLQSITTTAANNSTTQLLPAPTLSLIDSTLPYIYLPLESCQAFERTFGLSWNETDEMYWVNDTVHQGLLSTNPTITFTLGNTEWSAPAVVISLPYAAFDLEAKYPSVTSTRRYFPLQRSANSSQNTLGRTFLQEAYLITDYERHNFSVSQCKFQDGDSMKLIGIPSTTSSSTHQDRGLIIGTSIGAVLALLLTFFVLVFAIRRWLRRHKHSKQSDTSSESPRSSPKPWVTTVCSVREIDDNSLCGPIRELPDSGKAELLDDTSPSGSGNALPEMSPSMVPVAHELRTHNSSKVHSIIRAYSANNGSILKSTEISRKSWTSFGSSDGTPCVETVISASSRAAPHQASPSDAGLKFLSSSMPKLLDLSSVDLATRVMATKCRLPRPLDLDRSLPPTPISESPQISPSSERLNKSLSFCTGPQNSEMIPSAISRTLISPNIPTSKFFMTFSKHRSRHSCISAKGLEITIPPGQSDSTESEVSAISNEEPAPTTSWL